MKIKPWSWPSESAGPAFAFYSLQNGLLSCLIVPNPDFLGIIRRYFAWIEDIFDMEFRLKNTDWNFAAVSFGLETQKLRSVWPF